MNFGQALDVLRQGKKVKRKEWDRVWLATAANQCLIYMFLDGGTRHVTWSPTQGEILADDWEVSDFKPEPQTVKVPPNDFFRAMGAR